MDKRSERVLIIGHNVLDLRTAFGKTLASLFKGWDREKLAELYFHSEVPTTDICSRYYRITDTDALKSIFKSKKYALGRVFGLEDVDTQRASSRVDTGVKSKIYAMGRKRKPLIYIVRNSAWHLSKWYNDKLRSWLNEFKPDVIFFVAGDYSFAYRIAYKIAKEYDIPIVTYCGDDYYINRLNPRALLSKSVYNDLMRNVKKCISHSSSVVTICDKMADAYKALFDLPIHTVYTGYSTKGQQNINGEGVVYLGNLGYSRYKSLIEIGRALLEISDGKCRLDVYSQENRPEILAELTEDNGIVFHGAVSSAEVNDIISKSMLVVHTECFSQENIRKVEYSVSTKIADLLASGHCILAYGPKEVASIEYLLKNQAACVVYDRASLRDELKGIILNAKKRECIVKAAMALAEKNHSAACVSERIAEIIHCAVQK